HGHDQLARLIVDDAAVGGHGQWLAAGAGFTEKCLAAAPGNAEWLLCSQCRGHIGLQLFTAIAQNRSRWGKGSLPSCTCMAPNSAQRCRVGTALPGLSSPGGSKAAFTAWNWVSSSGGNCTHIWSIFSTPTPCSPVIVPPCSRHNWQMAPPKASVRSHSPSMLAS